MIRKLTILATLAAAMIIAIALIAVSSAVRDWSPEHQASAQATATAVAIVLAPTIAYNDNVLPTLQAAQAAVSENQIDQRHSRRMAFETVATVSVSTVLIVGVLAGGVWMGAKATKAVKIARLPAIQKAPGRGGLLLAAGGLYNPRTNGFHDLQAMSEPNTLLLDAHNQGEAAKIAAMLAVLAQKSSGSDRRVLEWMSVQAAPTLIEEGGSNG